jgi:hypothetical protein
MMIRDLARHGRAALAAPIAWSLALAPSAFAQSVDPGARALAAYALSADAQKNSGQYVYNFDAAKLPHLRAGIANLLGPTPSDFIWCNLGESTELGVITIGSSASTYSSAKTYSQSAYLVKGLNAAGIPAAADSFWGDGGSYEHTSTLPATDPRITISNCTGTACAASSQGFKVYGGVPLINGTTGAFIDFAVTPTTMPNGTVLNNDSVDVYYITRTTSGQYGTFTTQIDSGAVSGGVSTNAADSLTKVTITGLSTGAHTLHIAVTSGNVLIAGAEFYSSTVHRVRVRNMGYGGSQTGDWSATGHPWQPDVAMSAYGCGLASMNIGINDEINAVAPATTAANLALIYAAQANGGATDVVGITLFPVSASSTALATQQATYQAELSAMTKANIPYIDQFARSVSYAQGLTWGFYGSGDYVHPTQAGYGDAAALRLAAYRKVAGW